MKTFKSKSLALLLCIMMLVQVLTVGFTVSVSAADGVTEGILPTAVSGVATVYDGDPTKYFTMMGNYYNKGAAFQCGYSDKTAAVEYELPADTKVVTLEIGSIDDNENENDIVLQVIAGTDLVTELELYHNMPLTRYVINVNGASTLKLATKAKGNYYVFGFTNLTAYTEEAAKAADITVPKKIFEEPVYRTNLESGIIEPYYTHSRLTTYTGKKNESFSMMGVAYENGVTIDYSTIFGIQVDILYNLGGEFDVVTFLAGAIDNRGNEDQVLQIFGDGTLITEIDFTRYMNTATYSVNVSGVNQLSFSSKDKKNECAFALADVAAFKAEDGVSVPSTVSKDAYFATNYSSNTEVFTPYDHNSSFVDVYGGDTTDSFLMGGKGYFDGVVINYSGLLFNAKGGKVVNYNLGGMYHTMKFKLGALDGRDQQKLTLVVYKNSAVCEEFILTGDMGVIDVTIDVNGVNQLSFGVIGNTPGFAYGIADVVFDGYDIQRPNRFTDVKYGQWYYDGVLYAYNNGYMKGTNTAMTLFSPGMEFTREQFVQLLFNMERVNADDYKGDTGFSDVPANQWYSAAVKWAKEVGVTSGIGGGAFGLGGKVSREQLAQFLKNYSEMKGLDTSARSDLGAFEDNASISGWATEAVAWAVSAKLLGSTSADRMLVAPGRVAIRSEIAKVTKSYNEWREPVLF